VLAFAEARVSRRQMAGAPRRREFFLLHGLVVFSSEPPHAALALALALALATVKSVKEVRCDRRRYTHIT
jgi:hypothetical protein